MRCGLFCTKTGLSLTVVGLFIVFVAALAFLSLEGDYVMNKPLDFVQPGNNLSGEILRLFIHQKIVLRGATFSSEAL
jgi:hypothetical protein